jgi:predicted MFS family arabinose efflux permease
MGTTTLRRVFQAFQYRDFRLMWFGACTSSIGTWMQIVAQGWLIYRLSHSPFLLALDQFLGGIPIFLFSLIGGVVADRAERRKILLGSQYVQMASATILTLLVATGHVHVWHMLCLSFISGLAQAFGGPAYQALIPTLVNREDMPNAIALNSIQFNMAVTIGPALAGLALAKLGEQWCFGLNALSFLAPIISLSMITARYLPEKTTESMFGSLKEGIVFVRKQGSMEALIVLAFCMTALSMPMRTYIPVFVKDVFHRGPETYGNLLSLMGIGSICGSLIMAGMGNASHKGRVALTGLISLGAGISIFSFSRSLPLSYAMLGLVGASMMAVFATVTSLVQMTATNQMRGRVMSVYNCAFRGGMPMGNLLSGWLVPVFTAPVVLGLNGLALILMALYFLLVQRRVAAL